MAQASNQTIDKETKEKLRQTALHNLSGYNAALTAVFLSQGRYGDLGEDAVERYIYDPAISSTEAYDIILKGLKQNRTSKDAKTGSRYTGLIREVDILNNATKIITEAFPQVTIEDVYDLVNFDNKKVPEKYKGKFVEELPEEVKKKLFDAYTKILLDTKVAEALISRANDVSGGLEKILSQPEKPVLGGK